jgi:16S rRNA (guanine527-N7)-methyltransferase
MDLQHCAEYTLLALDDLARGRLAVLGDLLLTARSNVTAIRDPAGIERRHFLDSLTLLSLPPVAAAQAIVDIGAGAGFPSLVLAVALPATRVTAVESVRKKCEFMEQAAERLQLGNFSVVWGRAEDVAHTQMRESFDVATARALASWPVILEYGLPMVRLGGSVVAMKGAMSDLERTAGEEAAGILGGRVAAVERVHPFPGAANRWLYLVEKLRPTPGRYPRKAGVPGRRPLGGLQERDAGT